MNDEPRRIDDILPQVVDELRRARKRLDSYEGLAAVLRACKPTSSDTEHPLSEPTYAAAIGQWQLDVRTITMFLQENNPLFDREAFVDLLQADEAVATEVDG